MCFCEERQKIRSSYLSSRGTIGCQALGDLLDACLRLSLMRERPAMQESTTRPPERKPLRRGDADGGFRVLLGGLHLATELMEHGSKAQGETQGKRVSTLLRQGHCFVVPCQPLVRIAQIPQRPGVMTRADHPSVLAIEEGIDTVLRG